jgi:hypothetical protein
MSRSEKRGAKSYSPIGNPISGKEYKRDFNRRARRVNKVRLREGREDFVSEKRLSQCGRDVMEYKHEAKWLGEVYAPFRDRYRWFRK